MPSLPPEIMLLVQNFAPVLTMRTWQYVPALVVGRILTPRRRMVSSAVRALGLAQVTWFGTVQRVLNRAVWSPLAGSRELLGLLATAGHLHSALIMRLRLDAAFYTPAAAHTPDAGLPPCQRRPSAHAGAGRRRPRDGVDGGRRVRLVGRSGARRGDSLPDSGVVARRLAFRTAALSYVSVTPWGPSRRTPCCVPTQRPCPWTSCVGSCAAGGWRSLSRRAARTWALRRERQWTDKAIARTTPALFALFSLVTLLAHQVLAGQPCPVRDAAWSTKTRPTCSDALVLVRPTVWTQTDCRLSSAHDDRHKVPRALVDHLAHLLCYAA